MKRKIHPRTKRAATKSVLCLRDMEARKNCGLNTGKPCRAILGKRCRHPRVEPHRECNGLFAETRVRCVGLGVISDNLNMSRAGRVIRPSSALVVKKSAGPLVRTH